MTKLSRDTMLELMAYADGELEGKEKERVEALIAANEAARRVVEQMTGLGAEFQESYQAPAASLSDGIAESVLSKIERDEAAPRKPSVRPPKVVDLRDQREKRLKVGAAIVAAVALAAGIVLTTRHANENVQVAADKPPQLVRPPAPAPAPPPTPEPPQIAAAGGDVEQVDSKHEVEVFYLPSSVGANASSVVVWIDDKGTSR